MKIGDRIITTGSGAFQAGCTGTIVETHAHSYHYVLFDTSPDVDMTHGNSGYMNGTVPRVWAVHVANMKLLDTSAADEITELDGFIFTGVKQKEGSEWQPDEAVDNVMDITKGMFE